MLNKTKANNSKEYNEDYERKEQLLTSNLSTRTIVIKEDNAEDAIDAQVNNPLCKSCIGNIRNKNYYLENIMSNNRIMIDAQTRNNFIKNRKPKLE